MTQFIAFYVVDVAWFNGVHIYVSVLNEIHFDICLYSQRRHFNKLWPRGKAYKLRISSKDNIFSVLLNESFDRYFVCETDKQEKEIGPWINSL